MRPVPKSGAMTKSLHGVGNSHAIIDYETLPLAAARCLVRPLPQLVHHTRDHLVATPIDWGDSYLDNRPVD